MIESHHKYSLITWYFSTLQYIFIIKMAEYSYIV